MKLLSIHILNFRKIEDLEITFPSGLCVLVGENNAGKTAIVDALRLILFSGRDFEALRLNEDDFRRPSEGSPIEISCTFCDLDEVDEVHFQECLVDIGDGKFRARLNARAEFNPKTRRVNVKMWGGETEGGGLPSDLYDRFSSVYLKALRDPSSGLRPGAHSPGSGKTWTSCRRFIWRAANWDKDAGGLALLSFTNTAVREFHEATIGVGHREFLSDPNYLGTFDAFVERFIITPFGHLVTGRKERPRLFLGPRPGDHNNDKLKGWMNVGAKNRPVPAWDIIPYLTEDRKVGYKSSSQHGGREINLKWGSNPVNELFKLGYYTHQQRVFLACRLLKDRPHIAKCLARRFPEIIVDEAQDTNLWLLILLGYLRKYGSKVTLIGDPDQCIYEFSMADPTSLSKLKNKWKLPELLLSRSFRCRDPIASAVRNISCNNDFKGAGVALSDCCKPYIFRDSGKNSAASLVAFDKLLERANIAQQNAAILCRGHSQLDVIRGNSNYTQFEGLTKKLATAAFLRDVRKDYKEAASVVESVLRAMVDEPELWERLDDIPDDEYSRRVKIVLWRFTKLSSGLPGINRSGNDWIADLKSNLAKLFADIEIQNVPKLGQKIRKKGPSKDQLGLPLFEDQSHFPEIRHETIHKVKGESIDAVLVLGSAQFFNSVVTACVNDQSSEDRRLAYVAMTRARHALMIGLPASHFDKHIGTWKNWGFSVL